jgi:putative transposase
VGIVTVSGSGGRPGGGRGWWHEAVIHPHCRHRFPAEITSHALWLCHVFRLSLRDVELIVAERGIVVSFETVRRWRKKSGTTFGAIACDDRPRPGDKWHLDGVSRTHF